MGKRAKPEDWIILDRLADIILQNVKGCIVEIGIGTSTGIISKHARNFGCKYYACDIKDSKCEWFRDTYAKDTNFILYHGRSIEFIKGFDDRIALLFIDGNHKYENVREEAEFFIEKMVPGGVGFFHDMYVAPIHYDYYERKNRDEATTYKVRLEMEKRDDIWCLTFPYTAQNRGLTMILKKEENRPHYRI